MLIVLSYLLVSFSIPVLLFGFFLLLEKPFWNIAVYLPWLLYSIVKNVFLLGPYRGFWQMIHKFMHNDSVLGFYLFWLPSLIGFLLVNIAYFIYKRKQSRK